MDNLFQILPFVIYFLCDFAASICLKNKIYRACGIVSTGTNLFTVTHCRWIKTIQVERLRKTLDNDEHSFSSENYQEGEKNEESEC